MTKDEILKALEDRLHVLMIEQRQTDKEIKHIIEQIENIKTQK